MVKGNSSFYKQKDSKIIKSLLKPLFITYKKKKKKKKKKKLKKTIFKNKKKKKKKKKKHTK